MDTEQLKLLANLHPQTKNKGVKKTKGSSIILTL